MELLDDGEVVGYVSMLDSGDLHADAEKQAAKLVKKAGKQGKALKTPFQIKVGWGGPACSPILLGFDDVESGPSLIAARFALTIIPTLHNTNRT